MGFDNIRKAYTTKLEAKIEQLQAVANKRKAELKETAAEAQIETDPELKKVKEQIQQLQDQLQQLPDQAEETWNETKSKIEQQLEKVENMMRDSSND